PHRPDPAGVWIAAQNSLGDGTSRALHHRVNVVALLGGSHLVRRVERYEPEDHWCSMIATALASSRECVIERSIAPAPTRSAHSAIRPLRWTEGFGRPAISTSRQAKARATPKPSALPTASFPAKRPA